MEKRKFVPIINYNLQFSVCFVWQYGWVPVYGCSRSNRPIVLGNVPTDGTYCGETHCDDGRRHQTHGIFMAIDYLFKCITDSTHRTIFVFFCLFIFFFVCLFGWLVASRTYSTIVRCAARTSSSRHRHRRHSDTCWCCCTRNATSYIVHKYIYICTFNILSLCAPLMLCRQNGMHTAQFTVIILLSHRSISARFFCLLFQYSSSFKNFRHFEQRAVDGWRRKFYIYYRMQIDSEHTTKKKTK